MFHVKLYDLSEAANSRKPLVQEELYKGLVRHNCGHEQACLSALP